MNHNKREYQREWARKFRSTLTPEQKKIRSQRNRAWKSARLASLSPGERLDLRREINRGRMKRYYSMTPDQRKVRAAKHLEWLRRERLKPERRKALRLAGYVHRHGITREQVLELDRLAKCPFCKRAFTGTILSDKVGFGVTPHVDHDHSTGRVRGVVCLTCNNQLGVFEKMLRLNALEWVLPTPPVTPDWR